MKTLMIFFTTLVTVASTTLVTAENDMRYNYLELRLIADSELDDRDIDGDGLGFNGSIRLDELLYIVADYEMIEFDKNIDANVLQAGIGAILSANKVNVITELALVHFDTDIKGYDDTGYRVGIGARGYLMPKLELRGIVNRIDVDELEDTFFTLSADYFPSESFSVNLSKDIDADIERFAIGLRYYLGE